MLHLRGFPLAVLALTLCAPAGVCAQLAEDPAYRSSVDEAVREFSAGHWEEARALFKRAHELSPNARTLRGMGMAAFEMRLYVQAIRELEAALSDTRKPLDAELRSQVQQLITKAREFVGRVKPVLEPPSARLLIDGKEPQLEADGAVLLDVGTHVISATLDGYKSTNLRVSVEGGSDQVVRVPLEPLLPLDTTVPAIDPNQPRTQPGPAEPSATPGTQPAAAPAAAREPAEDNNLDTYAWIALVGAAGFGATAGVLWFGVGESKYDKLEGGCGATNAGCSDQQIANSGIETTDTLTSVFLGLALASGVTSGLLFAMHAAASNEDDPLALQAGPGHVALRGRF